MAPYEMDWQDSDLDAPAAMEAVDLTGSSPEPERRPRSILHQQNIPIHFKSEPRSYDRNRRPKKHEFRSSGVNRESLSQARAVAPHDLALIIDTSSPNAIKNVLLELCKMSPALSGAVARGLAAQSTYAQDLISEHQRAPRASAITPARTQIARSSASTYVKNELSPEQEAYEKIKKQLAPRMSAQGSGSRNAQASQSTSTARNSRAFGAQPGTSIKRQHPVDLGDSDSDQDSYIPRTFTSSGELKVPTPRFRRTASQMIGNGYTSRSTPMSEASSRTLQGESAEPMKKNCTQCEEDIDDEELGVPAALAASLGRK